MTKWRSENRGGTRERKRERECLCVCVCVFNPWQSLRSRSSIRYLEHLVPLTTRPQTRFSHSRFLIPETHSIRRLRAQNALVARGFLVWRLVPGRRGNYRQNVNMHYVAVSPSIRIWHHPPPGRPREIQPSAHPLDNLQSCRSFSLSLPPPPSLLSSLFGYLNYPFFYLQQRICLLFLFFRRFDTLDSRQKRIAIDRFSETVRQTFKMIPIACVYRFAKDISNHDHSSAKLQNNYKNFVFFYIKFCNKIQKYFLQP